jgi:hypothetical protein
MRSKRRGGLAARRAVRYLRHEKSSHQRLFNTILADNAMRVRSALPTPADPDAENHSVLHLAAPRGDVDGGPCASCCGVDIHDHNDVALRIAAVAERFGMVHFFITAGANPVTAWFATERIDGMQTVATLGVVPMLVTAQSPEPAATLGLFVKLRTICQTPRKTGGAADGEHKGERHEP